VEPQKDVFAPLNGMRGVAAIAVVLYHAEPFFGFNPASRGYLAVDLFFVLSGFVIAHAYEGRFAKGLTATRFLWQRIKRFYPLYALGHFMAAAWIALELIVSPPAILTPIQLVIATVVGGLFLPTRLTGDLYPLNGPAWSLLWELVINFIFGLIWRRTWLIAGMAAGCWAALLLIVGPGQLSQGAGDPLTGFLRAAFSFPVGVLIYRHHRSIPRLPIPPVLTIVAVAILLLVPIQDLVVVTLLFPIAIALLARCDQQHRRSFSFLGALSFPLYATHYPILQAGLGLEKHLPIPGPIMGIALVAVAIAFAMAADRWLDRRSYFRQRAS
jgi:peptidoglycan/LPS O-acetylase OafA/YrhL